MSKHPLSVFNYSYSKKYYLTHPWIFLNEFFQNCYHGWRRMIHGWTWEDAWNLDNWLIHVLPPMLKHIADYGCGFPGTAPFETPEKWNDWLHSIADVLESTWDENWDGQNEYAEEFHKNSEFTRRRKENPNGSISIWHEYTEEQEKIKRKYFEREKELSVRQLALQKDAINQLNNNLEKLWD